MRTSIPQLHASTHHVFLSSSQAHFRRLGSLWRVHKVVAMAAFGEVEREYKVVVHGGSGGMGGGVIMVVAGDGARSGRGWPWWCFTVELAGGFRRSRVAVWFCFVGHGFTVTGGVEGGGRWVVTVVESAGDGGRFC